MATLTACLLACSSALAAPADPKATNDRFRAAMEQARTGQHDVAIDQFRHLLREVPSPRIRLELARTLLHAGEYDESLSHFRDVYDDNDTPQAVKRNILPFMEEAELRVMRIRYGIRAVTDNNPGRVADGGTIYFNGIPLQYQPPVEKGIAYGLEPWMTAEKLWSNGYLTKFSTSARLFENEDLSSGRIHVSVGRAVAAVPGLFVRVNLDNEINKHNSYTLPTIEAWKRFTLSDRARIGIGGQAGYMFAETSDVSGGYYRPYAFGDWTVMPNVTLFGQLSVEHLNSKNDYYSYWTPKADIGVDFKLGQFNLTPQLSVSRTIYTQHDAFWDLKRRDTTVRPSITVSHEDFSWKGIKPELTVFHERRSSNVGIFEYDQLGASVNFRKAF